jgi:peptidoglycan/xylan/chitin deacetylase (PgdA/CDA1 family)
VKKIIKTNNKTIFFILLMAVTIFFSGCSLSDSTSDGQAANGIIDNSKLPSFSGSRIGEKQFDGSFIPIIGMHAIEDHIENPIELYTGHFDKLCRVLKEYGYETITLMELLDYIDNGNALPEKPVIITSDDGFQSVYTNAFPILKKYNYRMTVFLVTGVVGEKVSERKTNEYFEEGNKLGSPIRPLLVWPEIKEMYEYGCEFQSHTVNHKRLGIASDEAVLYELMQSKEDIESHIGNEVLFVALPKGNYNADKTHLFVEAGYRGLLRHAGGVEDIRTIDLFNIKRVEFNSLISPDRYAGYLGLDRSIEISYRINDIIQEEGEEFTIEYIVKNTGDKEAKITSMELELPEGIDLAGVSPDGSISSLPGMSKGIYMWVDDSYIIEEDSKINLIVILKGTKAEKSIIKFRATCRENYIDCDDIEIEIN